MILFFGIQSCLNFSDYQEKNNTGHQIKLDYSSYNSFDKVNFNEIIKDVSLVPLEGSKESFISLLGKLEFFKGKYYALDSREENIKVFDKNGKFIELIDNRGDFPGGYYSISDFEVFEDGILLLSPMGKLIMYNFEDKTFNTTSSFQSMVSSVHYFTGEKNEKIFYSLFDESQFYHIDIKDFNGQFLKSDFYNPNFNRTLRIVPPRSPFYTIKENKYFVTPYSYEVFLFEKGSLNINPFLEFLFGEKKFTFDDEQTRNNQNFEEISSLIQNKNLVIPILGFYHSNNVTGLTFLEGGGRGVSILTNTKTGQSYKIDIPEEVHSSFYPFFAFDEENIIGVFSPPVLTNSDFVNSIVDTAELTERSRLIEQFEKESNPIVIKYKINF